METRNMTKEKKFKQRVRERAEKTGESYACARRNEDAQEEVPAQKAYAEDNGLTMEELWEKFDDQEKEAIRRYNQRQGFLAMDEKDRWLDENPGLKVVTLTLTHNEHGTPTIHVTGPELNSVQVTQPPDVYVKAIRQAYVDSEWIKNRPRDDLGDLPPCTPEPDYSAPS